MTRRFPLLALTLSALCLLPSIGNARWRIDGTPVSTAYGIQTGPSMIGDGAGGVNIVWASGQPGTYDLYTQR
jgi:hypothetical protein